MCNCANRASHLRLQLISETILAMFAYNSTGMILTSGTFTLYPKCGVVSFTTGNRDSSVSYVTGLEAGRSKNCGSIPIRNTLFLNLMCG